MLVKVKYTLEIRTESILTPPHPRALAKSFPVPRGRTATGGDVHNFILSKMDNTQPTVPSPPHARIRRLGTRLYSSNLNVNQKTRYVSLFGSTAETLKKSKDLQIQHIHIYTERERCIYVTMYMYIF